MEKDQIIILEDRSLISVTGPEAKDFLQNILSNDVNKSDMSNSIYSAIFTPQGKYLYEFFLIKSIHGYFLDCSNEVVDDMMSHLLKYKLRSKVDVKDISSSFVVGIINLDKFKEIQLIKKTTNNTLLFRESFLFVDPRNSDLGARIVSNIEQLYLTIKKLDLNIVDSSNYLNKSHALGIPVKGTKFLKDQLFGLEANFEELAAIDFKKGCYVGQENTARMKLKNKIRRRLFPIKTKTNLKLGSELMFKSQVVGKILINGLYPFALIKLFDPNFDKFKNEEIFIDNEKIKIINIF
tara:strand:- start:1299 stop:2180 length:882 start_codon:yes stop_codon:yes gene_type:complete